MTKTNSNDRVFSDDEVITKLTKVNPKRENTKAAETWDKLRSGMTVAQARKVGFSPANLRWDIDHGWMEVGKAKAKAKPKSEAKPKAAKKAAAKKEEAPAEAPKERRDGEGNVVPYEPRQTA